MNASQKFFSLQNVSIFFLTLDKKKKTRWKRLTLLWNLTRILIKLPLTVLWKHDGYFFFLLSRAGTTIYKDDYTMVMDDGFSSGFCSLWFWFWRRCEETLRSAVWNQIDLSSSKSHRQKMTQTNNNRHILFNDLLTFYVLIISVHIFYDAHGHFALDTLHLVF